MSGITTEINTERKAEIDRLKQQQAYLETFYRTLESRKLVLFWQNVWTRFMQIVLIVVGVFIIVCYRLMTAICTDWIVRISRRSALSPEDQANIQMVLLAVGAAIFLLTLLNFWFLYLIRKKNKQLKTIALTTKELLHQTRANLEQSELQYKEFLKFSAAHERKEQERSGST